MGDGRGPLPGWAAPITWPITWPLARLYGAGVAWRNARFDRGHGVARLAHAPVISVGNLTAGGTGKSPMVAWCARLLADRGIQPVIAMRGYGARSPGASDEAREYACSAPGARLVVDPRRREALEAAFARWGAEPSAQARFARAAVILDDGFQHRRLARDLDIVLVDATKPGLDGDLLPNGWLRESAAGIARADVVVLTKAHDAAQRARAAEMVHRWRGRAPDGACEHVWSALAVHAEGTERREQVSWLAGRRVLSACALGNPAHFHGMVGRAAGSVPVTLERRDHAAFTAAELESEALRAGAEAVVVTRKDFVKLDRMPRVALAVPELGIGFIEGEDAFRDAVSAAATTRFAS